MATAYVSASRGDDTTGDGSATTPWKTITHAIGTSPAFTVDAGVPNTLYVEPGLYRETVTVSVASSASAPLSIIGDEDGSAFLAGGHATPAVGLVEIRSWSDDVTPIFANTIEVPFGCDHVTMSGFKIVSGKATNGAVHLPGSLYFTLRDCTVIGYLDTASGFGRCLLIAPTSPATNGATLTRCRFMTMASGGTAVGINALLGASDWSLGVSFVNCEFSGPSTGVFVDQAGGTGTFYPSGLSMQNCTFFGMQYAVYVHYGSNAITTPFPINGCACISSLLHADATGQVAEDGNVFSTLVINENMAVGANSVFGVCPSLNFGADLRSGLPLRPYLAPADVSTFNAFGSYGTVPTDDITGRSRPEGHASVSASAGCYERHDTGIQNFTYQDTGATACMALVGPSSHERLILVDPTSTTITVKVRWDGNHGDANKPQAVLIAEPQIGVAGQTVTATSTGGTGTTPNAYETLTFASFTPTGKGAVMLRLVSRAAAGGGIAYFSL